jgi:rubredoxin
MAAYTCLGCGYVFNEEKGVHAGGVAPNYNAMLKTGCSWHKNPESRKNVPVLPSTKWEDVPAEFICPSCGAPKELFE